MQSAALITLPFMLLVYGIFLAWAVMTIDGEGLETDEQDGDARMELPTALRDEGRRGLREEEEEEEEEEWEEV